MTIRKSILKYFKFDMSREGGFLRREIDLWAFGTLFY